MASRRLEIVIGGDSTGATRAIGNVESSLGKVTRGLGDVVKTAAGFALGFAFTRAPGILLDAAKAAAEDAASQVKLQKAVENTGVSWDQYAASLDATIDAGIQKGFADDQQRDALSLLMAQTGDAAEAQKRLGLAMDLARGTGMDLTSASRLVGKVTAENVEVFKRLGITIGEGATEADAFAAIQEKFGGQADAFAASAAGAWESFNLQMGELQEQIGGFLLPAFTTLGKVASETIGLLSEAISTGDFSGLVNRVTDIAIGLKDGLIDAVAGIDWPGVLQTVGDAALAAGGFAAGLLGDAAQLGLDLGGRLVAAVGEIKWPGVWEAVKTAATAAGGFIGGLLGDAAEAALTIGAKAIEIIGKIDWLAVAAALWEGAKTIGGIAVGLLGDVGEGAVSLGGKLIEMVGQIDWPGVWASITETAKNAGSFIGSLIGEAAAWAGEAFAKISEAVSKIDWPGVWTSITEAATAAGSFIGSLIGEAGAWAGEAFTKITEAIGQIDWPGIWTSVTEAAGAAGSFIGSLLGEAGAWVEEAYTKIAEAVAQIDWLGVWTAITDALAAAGSFVGALISDVAAFASDIGAKIGEAVGAVDWAVVWENVQKGASDLQVSLEELWAGLDWPAINKAAGDAADFAETVRLWVEDLIVKINATDWTILGRDIVKNIIDAITKKGGEEGEGGVAGGISPMLVLQILSLPGRLLVAIGTMALEIVLGIITEIGKGFVANWQKVADNLIARFKEVPGLLKATIDTQAKAIGESVITGIKAGIDGAVGQLTEAARAAAQSVVDTIKSIIPHGSPSPATIPYGQGVVDGLIEGMRLRMGALAEAAEATGVAILETLGTWLPPAGFDLATALSSSFERGLREGAPGAVGTVTDWVGALIDSAQYATDHPDQLGTVADTMVDSFLAGIQSRQAEAEAQVAAFVASINKAASQAADEAWTATHGYTMPSGSSDIAWTANNGYTMPSTASNDDLYWTARNGGSSKMPSTTVVNNYATINTRATHVDIPTEFGLMRARHGGRY